MFVIYAKLSFFFASFTTPALYAFALNFPDKNKKIITELILLILSSFFAILAVSSPLIVEDGNIETKEVFYGPIRNLFSAYILITTLLVIVVLILKLRKRKVETIVQSQLKIIIASNLMSTTIVIFTNLVLPQVINTSRYSGLGILGSIFAGTGILYSIRKYRFIDIRFLVGKITFYAFSSVLPYIIFLLLAYIYESNFGTSLNTVSFVFGLPIALGFVYLFNFTSTFLKDYTDSRLINPGYNPLEEADNLNKKLSNTIDLSEISRITTALIAKTIRPAYQGVFVIPEDEEKEWLSFAYKEQEPLSANDFKKTTNIWARLGNKPLIIDEFSAIKLDENEPIALILKQVSELMKKHRIKIIYPLVQKERIVGILLLGEKEADSLYSIQEIEFIDSLANTLALALGRSLLYEELQLFNVELQKRVEQATDELKVKNSSLERALSELEDKRRQERDMVDVMGHELRTPISIARNALAVLEDKFDKNNGVIDQEKLGKYLTMAAEATRREITLLETLLSATKLEGNRIQLTFTKVSVDELFEHTLEAHKYKAEEKQLELKIEKEPDLFIYADRVRTQEIIDNFLSNSIKYTAKGSVTLKAFRKDNNVRIEVIDTGIGIASDDLEKLGGKFFRARKLYGEDTAEDYVHPSGTGLGLFVTFELIHLMNGIRDITSEVGKGSNFAFEIPVYEGQKDQNIDQTFMENGIAPNLES